jgi:hypothetical protein
MKSTVKFYSVTFNCTFAFSFQIIDFQNVDKLTLNVDSIWPRFTAPQG